MAIAVTTLLLAFLNCVDQLRHHLEQIADDAVIGDFENRGIRDLY